MCQLILPKTIPYGGKDPPFRLILDGDELTKLWKDVAVTEISLTKDHDEDIFRITIDSNTPNVRGRLLLSMKLYKMVSTNSLN